MKIEWEQIENGNQANYLYRAKVFGGWLVKTSSDVITPRPSDDYHYMQSGWEWRDSITFVPDVKHEWEL